MMSQTSLLNICIILCVTWQALAFCDKTSKRFSYRNLKADDICEVAELCADCFEGPFGLVQFLKRRSAVQNFKEQITTRYKKLVLEGFKHTMIVCTGHEGEIVGFLECGMLPPPPIQEVVSAVATSESLEIKASQEDIQSVEDDVRTAIAAAAKELEIAEEEKRGNRREEVPYLGNVAVKETARRQGLGKSLVKLGIKIAQRLEDNIDEELYVIVDCSNSAALAMYGKLGFEVVLDERGLICRRGREPRLFLRKKFLH